jgi:hypothetical protein
MINLKDSILSKNLGVIAEPSDEAWNKALKGTEYNYSETLKGLA